VAAYIRSVMKNSMSNTVKIEFSKHNELYRNWLDLPLLVSVCVALFGSTFYCLLPNSTTHTPIRI